MPRLVFMGHAPHVAGGEPNLCGRTREGGCQPAHKCGRPHPAASEASRLNCRRSPNIGPMRRMSARGRRSDSVVVDPRDAAGV